MAQGRETEVGARTVTAAADIGLDGWVGLQGGKSLLGIKYRCWGAWTVIAAVGEAAGEASDLSTAHWGWVSGPAMVEKQRTEVILSSPNPAWLGLQGI